MLRSCVLPSLSLILASGLLAAADARFVRDQPSAPIYKQGWIDFNKNGVKDPYEDPELPVEQRVADLVSRMSLEEKTAQMVTWYGYPRIAKDELPTAAWKTSFWKDGIGNIDEHMNGLTGWKNEYATPVHAMPWSLHTRAINEVQRWFVEQTRLGIPVDFTNEGIRGLLHVKATAFPAEMGVGSSFDKALVREIGRVTGREAKVLGYTNVYSPVLELARDPRWGRVIESYGEDPFHVGEMGYQQVLGIQDQGIVSTVKHFAVYSVPKGGRDGDARTDPQVSWRDVQTIFLQPFRRAIRDAGALGVMASYNDYDGVPVEGSRKFLTNILRQELKFNGYVVSDSGAVEFIHQKHRVADTPEEGIRQAVDAGLNVRTNFTAPEAYAEPLRQLVRDGRLSMETLDLRVSEILRVKFWMGLFDQPYRAHPEEAERVVHNPEHQALAKRADREAIILLKNEKQALPLRKEAIKRILVAGPLGDDAHAWWSRYAPQKVDFITPLAGLKAKLLGVEVRFAKGVEAKDERYPESDVTKEPPTEMEQKGIQAAVEAAKDVDVIVAVLGETEELCQESNSRVSLDLPGQQEALLKALHATGKPVVLVLSNGRALSVNWAAKHVDAILEMWFPGETGGAALADVLLGDYNPAGRLPVTFPKSVGQIPLNFPTHPGAQDNDPGMVNGPLWPFGHGLSYTTFGYSNLVVTPNRQGPAGHVEVACTVTNTGKVAGDEVVQLYLRDDYSSVITFEKVLRGFERIHLQPGESKVVHFDLKPEHLALYDRAQQWTVEPGHFTVWVGASSTDLRLGGGFEIVAKN